LLQLLVDVMSFDHSKQLPLSHPGAYVHIPLLQMSIGAGINRRSAEWLYIFGKE
jgi:hypothetical protein